MKRSIYPSESAVQSAVIDWANINYLQIGKFLLKIPNEGKRSWNVSKKMKKEGLKKGVSDLFFAYPSSSFHGLWIEVKSINGKLSPEQKKWMDVMNEIGYKAIIIRTVDEGIQAIRDYLGMR